MHICKATKSWVGLQYVIGKLEGWGAGDNGCGLRFGFIGQRLKPCTGYQQADDRNYQKAGMLSVTG